MRRTGRIYVVVLAFLTLLTLFSGIAGNVAAAQLPSWIEPLLPWVWPVLGLLGVTTVVLAIVQARLDVSRHIEPVAQPIHIHVDIPASPIPASPIDSRPKVHTNLPQPDYSAFVGREEELAHVQRILRPYPHSQEHLVTIDGVGGVGKSALALEVAHRYLREYDALLSDDRFEAIIWASAKTAVLTADGIISRPQITRTLEDIYTTISIVLERTDITRAHPDEREGLVAKALTRQRTLLIVDNLETIDDDRVNTFLRELPAPTKVIVTTRHRIDVAYPVRLVGMPWKESQEMIVRECEKKGVGLSEEQMRRLYDRTGGVPLALVWSVAHIGYGHSPDEVLRRLGNPRGDLARFCFEGSVERIKGRSAYKVLLALAVFAIDADRDALGYVAGFGADVLSRDEGLVELEKLSLVNKRDGRFSLLPLTRTYATSLVVDEQTYRLRQEEFYLDFCRQYGGTTENWLNYSRIDLERQNLIDLAEWCLHNRRWQALIDLQDKLWSYWELRGYWSEQEKWCQNALQVCSELVADSPLHMDNNRKKGSFHLALCWVRINQDRFDEASIEANKAIDVLTPIEDWYGMAIAHRHLGLIEKLRGDLYQAQGHSDCAGEHFDQAREHYEIALDIWRRLDNQREVSSVLGNMGHLLIAQDKYTDARGFLEQTLVIRRRINDTSRISTTLRGLGELEELEGNAEESAAYYHEAFRTAEQVGDKQSAGRAKLRLARIALSMHECLEASRLATEARGSFLSLNQTDFLSRDVRKADEIIGLALWKQRTQRKDNVGLALW